MPGSSVAIGAGSATAAEEAAAAAAGNTEIRFEPGTRVVVDEPLPVPGGTAAEAQWYRTVTSRSSAAGVTTELAELKCYIAFRGLSAAASYGASAIQAIGTAHVLNWYAHLGQVTSALFGTVVAGTMVCLEKPTIGDTSIDLVAGDALEQSADNVSTVGDYADSTLVDSGGWDAGDVLTINVDNLNTDEYLYLVGRTPTAGVYGAGKFLLTFQCRYTVPYPA